MPRSQYTKNKWYWKPAEDKAGWNELSDDFPLQSAWRNYGEKYIDKSKQTTAVFTVNFPEMTFTMIKTLGADPEKYLLQRREVFSIQRERAEVDQQRGVESLPPFPHPFILDKIMTQKEQRMVQLSAQIREKPDWERKFRDPAILKKWREESGVRIDDDMFKFVIDELAYYESLQSGAIKPSTIDGVWQADGGVPESLREALLREVSKLENVPNKDKDWHPGSNGQVLNLVHPSLFCFVGGVTRQTQSPVNRPFSIIGGGQIETTDLTSVKHSYVTLVRGPDGTKIHEGEDKKESEPKAMDSQQTENSSKSYQWLPAEFGVDKSGQVSVLSYINNLDPRKHAPLYKVLTKILETFIPMWERVLTDLVHPRPRRYAPEEWYKEEEEKDEKDEEGDEKKRRKVEQAQEESESSDDTDSEDERVFQLPALPPFTPPAPPSHPVKLNGRRLQVIVKLANILLTPEKPEYKGGVWHVEGMNNEHIVSSGIYYYDSENSRLDFRVAVGEPDYEQNDSRGVSKVYGIADEEPLNQPLGSIITKSGRSIAFPNLYQHFVKPFALQDPTKSGYRKILVFFLVDPSQMVLSTLHVPPQQPSWLCDKLATLRPFNTLPPHALSLIVDYTTTMSKESAERHREKLMQERKFFEKKNSESLFERPFSLCEH